MAFLAYQLLERIKQYKMFGISLKKNIEKNVTHQKYYKCDRCGYITIVRDSSCPICAKDGFKIKMK